MLSPTRSTESQEGFEIITVGGRPMLAISSRGPRFRAAAVSRFPVYSLRRRVFRRLIKSAISLRVNWLWSYQESVPESLIGTFDFAGWSQFVRKKLGRQDIYPVIHGPPQLERRRAYIHLLNSAGKPVAFAKLALDELNNSQLEREIKTLALVRSRAPKRFRTPDILATGFFEGNRYVLYEPLPTSISAVKLSWKLLQPALNEIAFDQITMDNDAVLKSEWWRQLNTLEAVKPRFVRTLRPLLEEGLPVCFAHGDMGINNLVISRGVLWIVDWEEGALSSPIRTDEISYYLCLHQRHVLAQPQRALARFARLLLIGRSRETWRDVLAALAYLAASDRTSAQALLSVWNLRFPEPSGRAPNGLRAGRSG